MPRRLSFVCLLIISSFHAPASAAADAPSPRVNHIACYVRDLAVSTDFYRDVIGLPIIPEPFRDGRHTWFLIGPKTHLHIISGATVDLPKDKNTHLCFSVESVDAFIARLEKRNLQYENWLGQQNAVTVRPDGVKQIYFRDPDGYWLEINDARD
jgi:lactoylglutathione lyase